MRNSLGRAPFGGSNVVRRHSLGARVFRTNYITANVSKNCVPKTCQAVCKHWAIASLARLFARVFQDKLPQCDCAEKLCAQDLSSGVQKHWAMGHAA